MDEKTLFSIGHGNKKIEVFINELKAFNIEYLLDIRSKPYSKWSPQFNQNELKFALEKVGIKYVFVGDVLGGLPEDRTCYDENGKVVYDLIKEKDFFKTGLQRLITAYEKKIPLSIMCSESNPQECHRTKLIGQELLNYKISIEHIISEKVSKPQAVVMSEITKGKNIVDLFGNKIDFTSRKSY